MCFRLANLFNVHCCSRKCVVTPTLGSKTDGMCRWCRQKDWIEFWVALSRRTIKERFFPSAVFEKYSKFQACSSHLNPGTSQLRKCKLGTSQGVRGGIVVVVVVVGIVALSHHYLCKVWIWYWENAGIVDSICGCIGPVSLPVHVKYFLCPLYLQKKGIAQGLSASTLLTFWMDTTLCGDTCFVLYRMAYSIPDFAHGCNAILSLVVTIKGISKCLHLFEEMKLT